MKDVIIAFLLGIIVGMVSIVVIALSFSDTTPELLWQARQGKNASTPHSGVAAVAEGIKNKLIPGAKKTGKDPFHIDFETASDLKFFQLTDGLYAEISSEKASSGRHSLFLEFPKGAAYPGLYWEVYSEKQLIDLSGANAFGFDAYNNGMTNVPIVIKIKANKNYPKDVFEKTVILQAGKWNKVRIPVSELARKLDVSKISYIKVFIPSPKMTFEIFLDNLGVFSPSMAKLRPPFKYRASRFFFARVRLGQQRLSRLRQA